MDIARGLAALWVFLFHTKELFAQSSPLIYEFAKYGALGVPMFFVISGYVITYSAESTLSKQSAPTKFLRNRFLRIYPTFWISILVVLLIPYIIEIISMFKSGSYVQPESLVSRLSTIEWFYFVTLTKAFLTKGSDIQEQFSSINSVYWSLAIEFQFYLIVYVALYFKKHFRQILFVITCISLLNQIFPMGFNGGFFIHYWQMFACGIVLAYLNKYKLHFKKLVPEHSLNISSLLSIILLVPLIIYINVNESISNFAFALVFTLMLWIITPFEIVLVHLKQKKLTKYILEVFLMLGAMSYSIYLLHAKLYQLPEMFVRQIVEPDNIIYGLLTITLTIILCAPFYYLVETKFMSKNYSKIHNKIIS